MRHLVLSLNLLPFVLLPPLLYFVVAKFINWMLIIWRSSYISASGLYWFFSVSCLLTSPLPLCPQANTMHLVSRIDGLYYLCALSWFFQLQQWCLYFYLFQRELTIYFLVYVDDSLITGNYTPFIHKIIDAFSNRFSV